LLSAGILAGWMSDAALTYNDVRTLPALPASVAVVGGADTGCQLASILADFGANVTLLEASPRLVPRSDVDVSEGLRDAFQRRGMSVLLDSVVEKLEPTPDGVAVDVQALSGRISLPPVTSTG
jgi:pyruvate/2-oxoglutarate dehydrogenase complex dihydrolipoamide dehydrogenase (E3) component